MAGEDTGVEAGISGSQEYANDINPKKSTEVQEPMPNNDLNKQVSTFTETPPLIPIFGETEKEIQNQSKEKSKTEINTDEVQEKKVQEEQDDGIVPLTFQEKIYNFLHGGETNKLRSEVKEIADDLSNRIDMQKLIQDDLVLHSGGQYREILGILNGINEGKHNNQGYIENTAVKSALERIGKEWEERGLLKDTDKKNETVGNKEPVRLNEEELLKRRNLLLESIISSYEKMEESYLSVNGRETATNFVSGLTSIKTILNLEDRNEKFNLSRYGYNLPEFDQKFLEAAKQQAQNLFDSHREAVIERIKEHQKDMSEQNLQKLADAFAPQVQIGWEGSVKEEGSEKSL